MVGEFHLGHEVFEETRIHARKISLGALVNVWRPMERDAKPGQDLFYRSINRNSVAARKLDFGSDAPSGL